MKDESLGIVLASGNVLRCHTVPCLKQQTIGQHTWRAMVLLHWLYDPYYPPAHVTYDLMMHDVPEIHTGDTPGHVKAQHLPLKEYLEQLEHEFSLEHGLKKPNAPPLSKQEELIVGLCDRADLVLYALDELEMGNRFMSEIAHNAYVMAHDVARNLSEMKYLTSGREKELMRALRNRMEDLLGRKEGYD